MRIRFSGASALMLLVPLTGGFADARDDIHDFVDRVMATDVTPGLALVVVDGDDIVTARGFGWADREAERPVTADTVFYIASVTKSFTGLAGAILHEAGALDLDASLATLAPHLAFADGLEPGTITLRDLFTHTHGIENHGPVTFRLAFTGEHSNDGLRALLAHHGPREAGRAFRYGNIGYNVATLATDRALGIPWQDLLAREIFIPLGMTSTTARVSTVDRDRLAEPYRMEPDGWTRIPYAKFDSNMQSAGGLVTTANDLGRWLEAQMNAGVVDGMEAIDAAAIHGAHRPHATQDNRFMSFERSGYGLGWHTGTYDGDDLLHHFGGFSGFHAHVSFMPERRIGVAILANDVRGGAFAADAVSRFVYDRLRTVEGLAARADSSIAAFDVNLPRLRHAIAADREKRAARPQTLPHPLPAYVGTYASDVYGTIDIRLVDGALRVAMGVAESGVETFDAEANQLRVELTGRGGVITVSMNDNGRASSVQFLDEKFRRVGQ